MSEDPLHDFAIQQARLISTDQLLHSQQARQEELTTELIKFSKDIISELRLLSLVRSRIIQDKSLKVEQILKSQTFQGLKFSKLEYCPTFIDPNRLNHYMYLTGYLRRRPAILAQVLFEYTIQIPAKLPNVAYSLFLAIFQQGWCLEEDKLLSKTLRHLAVLQFLPSSKHIEDLVIPPNPPRLLKIPLSSPAITVSKYEPFASFFAAYLFNGASFEFLQSALAPYIIKLHSLSRLYNLRTSFEVDPQTSATAALDYWREIVKYTLLCFESMIRCSELLPPGIFKLMKRLKSLGADLNILFFEAFVNRALDNPAVLGLLPWHPSHGDWRPAKDIADVFRSKFCDSIKAKSPYFLRQILEPLPDYQKINLSSFYDILCGQTFSSTFMINETDLLATNPNFPKEVLITGKDLCLLHDAVLHLPDATAVDPELKKAVDRLGAVPPKNAMMGEHFRIVITRAQEATAKAKEKAKESESLFGADKEFVREKDPYAELFSDIIVNLPSIELAIASIKPKTLSELLSKLRLVSPLFLPQKYIIQADASLYFANSIVKDVNSLIDRIKKVADYRDVWALRASDRTSSLRSQHQFIDSSLQIVRDMRANVQSHLLLQLAERFVEDDMCQVYRESMLHGDEFVSNRDVFRGKSLEVIHNAEKRLKDLKVPEEKVRPISRILFFKLTDHITFKRYMLSDPDLWKKSTTITSVVEKNYDSILEGLNKETDESFEMKKPYLERAGNLLGHIRPNSGTSVILHYILEAADIIQTLCDKCRELNLDICLVWVLITSRVKHLLMLSKFVQHFLLGEGLLDTLFTTKEVGLLNIFTSGVMLITNKCHDFDSRISRAWA